MSASNLLSDGQLVAGASGSLMGFLGLAIAGGHREGTAHGIAVRDLMIRWTVFIGFLGLAAQATGFMNIANIAHAGGLVAGLAIGWVLPLRRVDGRTTLRRVHATALALALATAVVAFGVAGMLQSALAIQAFDECVDDLKNKRVEASLDSCRRAVDENPSEVGAWHNLAYAYIKAERGDGAVAICREAREALGADVRKSEVCRMLLAE